ncbi:ABC transporter substrate-binding protein [Aureibacillus halotolerans]|uniref:Carbohydrate ABC transporter substrate-binding protein (CUT1 family) n=1 Tax=Aureibacillus halotolerans TaxID=1508390 RepID=A0A4R6U4W2_9BACI|nr:extracellular solute-binding protein [Aureibacillus halotolerans]TDQ41221.1 carbohydrate ABC transporter substrate-binding protein (CUT1 family) [Aureibacillus halotolerans]
MKSRLRKYIGSFGLISMLTVAGCAGSGSSGGETASSGDTTTGEDVTQISFIHWRGEDVDAFEKIISDFESANQSVQVEMNTYPSEQYQSNAQQMLRSGSVGDVFAVFPGSQFEIMKKAGLMADLTEEAFVSNFEETPIEVGQVDGKQYALPYQMVFNMPVYNKDLIEAAGFDEIPQSWEGFLAMAKALDEKGIAPIAIPAADIGVGQFMNSMVMNNSEDGIFEKLGAGEASLTDEWWVKTLTQIKELLDLGYFQDNPLGTQQDAAMALVARGEAAMLATGSYHMSSLKELNPELSLDLLAPITVSEDQKRYDGIHTATFMLAVNENSEKKEAAKAFIDYLSQPEVASYYANETGQHLTVKDVTYEDESLQNTAYWLSEKETRFQPRYMITNAQVEKAVLSSIENVLGGASPEEAAAEAQKIVEENLQ